MFWAMIFCWDFEVPKIPPKGFFHHGKLVSIRLPKLLKHRRWLKNVWFEYLP